MTLLHNPKFIIHAQELKVEFQGHFRNISRVMDCVGCDKCKLWGKLQVALQREFHNWLYVEKCRKNNDHASQQVTGLGTALKILFSGDFDQDRGSELTSSNQDLPRHKPDLALSRNEVVSLFNAFGKISTSIVQLEKFREMLRKR